MVYSWAMHTTPNHLTHDEWNAIRGLFESAIGEMENVTGSAARDTIVHVAYDIVPDWDRLVAAEPELKAYATACV